uniref:NAD(P)-dependent dehydrogenase, short-chain alcohol dehydrogenase family n=1 Tax=Candidatus Kentrum sp. LFY TaxID=2126342 RepID=A0A450UW27_9GAMM|nr:MAG: NAD(P)-dependent dehydrogenase, short-chain alcohol dehydrogenase family [Candidatus Kentron sp. LFY]
MKNLFITGVSSGLGYALAKLYLDHDWRVFGISRRAPDDAMMAHPSFWFRRFDLRQHGNANSMIKELLNGIEGLDVAILNAGVFGEIGDLANISLPELKDIMDTNVWANKTIIDHLYINDRTIGQIVTISSGASINGNRGWAGYAVSKAALNMLTKLYAREHPDTHFCALAPGIIDTPMAKHICRQLSDDERFPAVKGFCAKREGGELWTPGQAAQVVMDTIERLPKLIASGAFADVRELSAAME